MFVSRLFLVFLLVLPLFSCSRIKQEVREVAGEVFFTVTNGEETANRGAGGSDVAAPGGEVATDSEFTAKLSAVIGNAELPAALARKIQTAATENPSFIVDLLICLEAGRYLRELVDKRHSLPQDYVPADLVELKEGTYRLGRAGLHLRKVAADALEEMAAAARADGAVLTVASAYRSYNYQVSLYNRYVEEMGREAADRESARPGHSQHQLGLIVDFGPVDNAFAETGAGRWVAANASRFGWSISYPDGYEPLTGYSWESWHYRYVGRDLAAFIDNYFDGIQQYALRFLHEWNLY